jgi:hypothetical protein
LKDKTIMPFQFHFLWKTCKTCPDQTVFL